MGDGEKCFTGTATWESTTISRLDVSMVGRMSDAVVAVSAEEDTGRKRTFDEENASWRGGREVSGRRVE